MTRSMVGPTLTSLAAAVLLVFLAASPMPRFQVESATPNPEGLASYVRSLMRDTVNVPPPRRQWNELVMLVLGGHAREAAYFERYVFGINMRNLAVDSLLVADRYLRARDLVNAQAQVDRARRYLDGSREAFSAADQAFVSATYVAMNRLELFYRFTSTFARNLGVSACGHVCVAYLDAMFFPIDFAVNEAMYGRDEAGRRAMAELVARTLVNVGLSQFIARENAELMDKVGLYRLVQRVGGTEEFQNTFINMISHTIPFQERRALTRAIQAGLRRILDILLSPNTPVVAPPLGDAAGGAQGQVTVVWRASQVRWDCAGPRDRSGQPWHNPAFDDRDWPVITLPDVQHQTEASDRFYRGVFALLRIPRAVTVTVASDDALWLYLNGVQVGHWGGGCYTEGCVNDPLGMCGTNSVVAPIDVTRFLVTSRNVIAAHVTDRGQGGGRVFRLEFQIVP